MKLSTALIAGAVVAGAATATVPAHAGVVGQVFETYNYSSGDSASLYVHSTGAALSNVCIDGVCGLSAPAGGNTASVNLGDPGEGGPSSVTVTGSQFAPATVSVPDFDTEIGAPGALVGSLTGVPEPATMGILGVSLLGLGIARRRRS